MLRNIVAVKRDGSDVRVITILCEVPDARFYLPAAAKAAAIEYCHTEEGRAVYKDNFKQFDWTDFEFYVPNSICEKHGFKVVKTALSHEEVNWDEQLVHEDDLEDDDENLVDEED